MAKAPMFARRHYEAIAETIRTMPIDSVPRTVAAMTLADAFEQDHPSFDYKRFLKACGVTETVSPR